MKTTILGGVLFLVPLAFVAIVLTKTYQLSLLIARPLDGVVPLDRFAGVAVVDILAILFILAICFLAGLAARSGFLASHVEKLDGFMVDIMPGYAVARGMIGSVSSADDVASVLTPVLVRFDDYDQIAFELERNDERAVVFLPGAPSAWSGSSLIVDVARITPLNLPAHQLTKLLRVLGRGTLKLPEVGGAKS